MKLPPATIPIELETVRAVSRLFTAIADHNNAIGNATKNAVESGDLDL